jgi:hypothetical protein
VIVADFPEWLSAFQLRAASKARLLQAAAVNVGSPGGEPELSELRLEFSDFAPVRLTCHPGGEGFDVDAEPLSDDGDRIDLAHDAPFASVVKRPLQMATLITQPVRWEDPRRGPMDSPIGVRLQFDQGDVWILNIWDQADLFDRRPTFWREHELSEWASEDAAEGGRSG